MYSLIHQGKKKHRGDTRWLGQYFKKMCGKIPDKVCKNGSFASFLTILKKPDLVHTAFHISAGIYSVTLFAGMHGADEANEVEYCKYRADNILKSP